MATHLADDQEISAGRSDPDPDPSAPRHQSQALNHAALDDATQELAALIVEQAMTNKL